MKFKFLIIERDDSVTIETIEAKSIDEAYEVVDGWVTNPECRCLHLTAKLERALRAVL